MSEQPQEPVLRMTLWRANKTYQPGENVWHGGHPYQARNVTKREPPGDDWEPLIY